jgi:3',5'-cyclic-nucleotide phosphodiesterase/cAMP-specific phosphodiesterase 4
MCRLKLNISLDVGHGAKELKLHKLWSRRIIEEFFL